MGKFVLDGQLVLVTGGSQGLGKQFGHYYYEQSNSKIVLVSRSEMKLCKAISEITGGLNEPVKLDLVRCAIPQGGVSGTAREGDCDNDNGHNEHNHDGESSGLLRSNSNSSYRNNSSSTTGLRGDGSINSNGPSSKNRLFYFPCDLSDADEVEKLFAVLEFNNLLPTQILNCAGGSIPKLFTDLTPKELEMGVKVNYMTTLFVVHRAMQLVPTAHVMLFSSATAFFPFIGYSQYAPAKVSLKALASILRHELPNTRISCIYPGNFYSEGYILEEMSKPEITRSIEGSSYPISCEECCDKIVWWLQHGYDDITTDSVGWLLMSLDMGLNKHNNNSAYWFLQWLVGVAANLLIVPFYMVLCSYQIRKWHQKNKNSAHTPISSTLGIE